MHVGYEDCGVGFDGILAEADFYRMDDFDGADCPAVTYRGELSERGGSVNLDSGLSGVSA